MLSKKLITTQCLFILGKYQHTRVALVCDHLLTNKMQGEKTNISPTMKSVVCLFGV